MEQQRSMTRPAVRDERLLVGIGKTRKINKKAALEVTNKEAHAQV